MNTVTSPRSMKRTVQHRRVVTTGIVRQSSFVYLTIFCIRRGGSAGNLMLDRIEWSEAMSLSRLVSLHGRGEKMEEESEQVVLFMKLGNFSRSGRACKDRPKADRGSRPEQSTAR
jgi:hypothetical protein